MVTLSSGSLTVSGNYTNSATFTAGSGTVYFNGASAQALTDNSTSGTTLNNVNFGGTGTKTLSGTGSFAESSSELLLTMGAGATLQNRWYPHAQFIEHRFGNSGRNSIYLSNHR